MVLSVFKTTPNNLILNTNLKTLVMNIVKKYLPNNQYMIEPHDKKMIVLHHTVGGSAKSAIDWWNQDPERVGVAYVIDRDGTVYEVFPPEDWAYALGIKGAPHDLDKISIQIEIVSWGWLTNQDYKFFVTLGEHKVFIPKDEVIDIDFRGYKHYHKYSDEQVTSVCELVKELNEKFNMNLQYKDNFWEFDQSVIDHNTPGLISHTTVRKDKTDIFPQPNLIEALKEILPLKTLTKKIQ
jgi:N-acetyl-anhydromuramyl-L-alanine amidase AmpD